jgi:hypothetical protein
MKLADFKKTLETVTTARNRGNAARKRFVKRVTKAKAKLDAGDMSPNRYREFCEYEKTKALTAAEDVRSALALGRSTLEQWELPADPVKRHQFFREHFIGSARFVEPFAVESQHDHEGQLIAELRELREENTRQRWSHDLQNYQPMELATLARSAAASQNAALIAMIHREHWRRLMLPGSYSGPEFQIMVGSAVDNAKAAVQLPDTHGKAPEQVAELEWAVRHLDAIEKGLTLDQQQQADDLDADERYRQHDPDEAYRVKREEESKLEADAERDINKLLVEDFKRMLAEDEPAAEEGTVH